MSWSDRADRMLGIAVRTFGHTDQDGETLVRYVPATGPAYDITAVFDRSHVSVDPNTGAAVSSNNPVLGIQLSQLHAEHKKGDRVRIGSTLYKITDFQRDGVAGALMVLGT